jgi:hypothetical protein
MGSPPGYPTEPPLGPTDRPPLGGAPGQVPWTGGQSPGPPPAGRGRWIVLWSLLAVAALAAAVLGVAVVGDDGAGGVASTPEPPAGEPGEASAGSGYDTTGTPTEAEIDGLVADLSAFVEDERGLEFREPVRVEIEDDDGFHERLFDDFEEESPEIAEYEPLYQATGLIGPGDDLVETLRTAFEGAVIGFYDPETGEMVVRGAAITPAVRSTVAHELTHALDDQHFGLDRPEYDDADDEVGFGFSGLVEGSAVAVETAYVATFSAGEEAQLFEEQLAHGLPDVPLALLELITAPYRHGPGLVAALRAEGGRERLDTAFAEPPRTSEQVIHPDAYLDGEARLAVEHPVADGEVAWEGVLGELFVELVLSQEVGDQAAAAAEGWGGDWATTWRDGERSCMRAVFVGDTPDDSDELFAAWSAWAEEVDGAASAEQPEAGGEVTVSSCTDGSAARGGAGSAP